MPDGAIIITGAGQGIGRATALRLAHEGQTVVVNARTRAHLDTLCDAVEEAGGTAHEAAGNVADPQVIERLVRTALSAEGGIGGLVTCASLAPLQPILELEPDTFDRVIALNVRSVYLLTRAVWPHMIKNGRGVIVHISSMSSVDPFTGFGVYGGSKAFVNAFVKGIAAEGEPDNIRVYSVAPGAVETGMLRGLFPDFPANECLSTDEVAEVIVDLLADRTDTPSGDTVFLSRQT